MILAAIERKLFVIHVGLSYMWYYVGHKQIVKKAYNICKMAAADFIFTFLLLLLFANRPFPIVDSSLRMVFFRCPSVRMICLRRSIN